MPLFLWLSVHNSGNRAPTPSRRQTPSHQHRVTLDLGVAIRTCALVRAALSDDDVAAMTDAARGPAMTSSSSQPAAAQRGSEVEGAVAGLPGGAHTAGPTEHCRCDDAAAVDECCNYDDDGGGSGGGDCGDGHRCVTSIPIPQLGDDGARAERALRLLCAVLGHVDAADPAAPQLDFGSAPLSEEDADALPPSPCVGTLLEAAAQADYLACPNEVIDALLAPIARAAMEPTFDIMGLPVAAAQTSASSLHQRGARIDALRHAAVHLVD